MATKHNPSARAKAFKAWMRQANTNTTQVANRAGVPYTTLASFVQGGTQGLKGETEEKIALAFGATADTIFGGQVRSTTILPVISFVAAGQLTDADTQIPHETETIEISGLEPGDYFGTRARGDSMDRIAPDGSLLVVNRADRELVKGRRYIFSHRGQTTFKRYGGTDPMRLDPESLNPINEPIYPKESEPWSVVGRVRMIVIEL